jgi:hypothetical protein
VELDFLRETVKPVAALFGLGSGLLALLDPNTLLVLGGWAWANIGTLFGGFSTVGFVVIPELSLPDWLQPVANAVQAIALALAVVFALKKLDDARLALEDRL